jgi:ABC-type multidrug transport system fused ATPase/permease subunit
MHALLLTDYSTPPSDYRESLFYVLVYAAIGLGGVVITTINTVVQYHGAIRASRSLFTRLLDTLVHATMRWHDITPTGNDLFGLSPI